VGRALTDYEVDRYSREGCMSPFDLLTADEASEARAALEAHEESLGGSLGPVLRSGSHMLLPWVDDLMRHPRLLDAVEDLIGPDILCWNSIFWIKEPGSASYVGWHQDFEYWGLDDDRLVSVWIALSPASEAAGCMSVLPGSHRAPIGHRETYAPDNLLSRGQELDIDPAEHSPVAMPLESGQVSFHNVRTAHGSGPNTTTDRRIGLSFHYMPTCTRQTKVDWDAAALVRGVDEFGHFAHCPRPGTDMDPETLPFFERAAGAMREIIYAGARPTTPTI
jgi:hypothetical protein